MEHLRREDINLELDDLGAKNHKLEAQPLNQLADQECLSTQENLPSSRKDSLFDLGSARFFTEKQKMYSRIAVVCLIVIFLMLGRFSVPDNDIPQIEDKMFNLLENVTRFILTPGNEFYRDLLQIVGSELIDTVFLSLMIYWILYGKTSRLVMSQAIFYATRAILQKVYFSPFPDLYYWGTPIIPSLVVPYGKGSDFFFSGHAGFLVLCANEWHQLGKKKHRNYAIFVLLFTIFVLFTFRIHYSIDVFAGIFYADWCFTKVNQNKDAIDNFWGDAIARVRLFFQKKNK